MNDSTIIRYVRNEELPEKPQVTRRFNFEGDSRWNRVVRFLEANATADGWYSVAEFSIADPADRDSVRQAQGKASNVVQHLSGQSTRHHYLAVRKSAHTFEATARIERDMVVVYARALPLEVEPIVMPEFGAGQ